MRDHVAPALRHVAPARRRAALSLALVAFATIALSGRAQAQLIPADLLNRLLRLEAADGQQASDLLSVTGDLGTLRTAVTALDRTASDQGALLDLSLADLDALSLDVADLRSTLGTIDVDLLANNSRDDAQDATLADHERRITTNSADIAAHERRIATNTADIAGNTSAIARHDSRISANTADIASSRSIIAEVGATLIRHERDIADTRAITGVHTVEIADLRADTDDNTRRLDGHDRDIAVLQREVGQDLKGFRSELDAQGERIDTATDGVAMAFALNSPAVAPDKSFALSGGFGHFEGRSAFAVSGGIRAGESVQFDGGLAVGLDSGSVGGRAGATISW